MASVGVVVIDREAELPPGFSMSDVPAMDRPRGVLMCAPNHYDVVDVKNPFMEGRAGTVDRAAGQIEWRELRSAFSRAGAAIKSIAPLPGCEDMVFCANPALLGLDPSGAKTCAPGRMTFASRQPEVASIVKWCESEGYRLADLGDPSLRFEGGGDAVWHPGRRLIWGGYPWRTDKAIYPALGAAFGAPVITIELVDPQFYHLDTCMCALDDRTALVYPNAIAVDGLRLIRRCFERVLEVDAAEAGAFACNAASFSGRTIVLDRRASSTGDRLRALGYTVIEVDTGEFLKSGGSVYCMKNSYY